MCPHLKMEFYWVPTNKPSNSEEEVEAGESEVKETSLGCGEILWQVPPYIVHMLSYLPYVTYKYTNYLLETLGSCGFVVLPSYEHQDASSSILHSLIVTTEIHPIRFPSFFLFPYTSLSWFLSPNMMLMMLMGRNK